MPTAGGPNTLGESNLVFAIDTHDTSNGITPLGCGGFNGSTQGVKNLLTGTIYPFINGMKLTGRSYFTSFAIDYPESAYGGDAASRQGIATGYDVRSGGGLYGASRALHLWVYNNDTNSWIDNGATTYFRGARLGGHCYDNFGGAENGYLNEIALFISDYNTLKSTFTNCTFIVMGSHRADQYTSTLRAILYDLGMPTGYIDSDYIAAPEWILVGEPGLGTGNAFGWVYENYTTNGAQVAHINFGLPIRARGGIEFDGTNDYINIGQLNITNTPFTYETVIKTASTTGGYAWILGKPGWNMGLNRYNNYIQFFLYDSTNTLISVAGGTLDTISYFHIVGVYTGSVLQLFINGILISTSGTITTPKNYDGSNTYIGTPNGSNLFFQGEIPATKIYNRALTAQEIKQNYQQYKTRFNLS